MKKCSKCKVEKPLSEYRKKRYSCRACDRAKDVAYRRSDRGRAMAAAWRSLPGNKRKDSDYQKSYRARNPARNLVRHAKARAIAKGVSFDLDAHIENLEARISSGRCEVTGIRFVFEARHWASPSLDRIIPSDGYRIENVRVIIHGLNCALGTWGVGVLREIVGKIP